MSSDLPAIKPETALVLPDTGELIFLEDRPAVAEAMDRMREMKRAIDEAMRACTEALVEESRRQGSRTLKLKPWLEVTISGGSETVYDHEELEKLKDAGLPEERFDELVTVEVKYKVNALQAQRIAKDNEEYRRIIENASSVREVPFRASVKRK